jgi:hypothetical protein
MYVSFSAGVPVWLLNSVKYFQHPYQRQKKYNFAVGKALKMASNMRLQEFYMRIVLENKKRSHPPKTSNYSFPDNFLKKLVPSVDNYKKTYRRQNL